MTSEGDDRTRARALMTLTASITVAAILSIVVILPAEIGWDPLGTGEALGVMGLSGSDEVRQVVATTGDIRGDERTFVLDPFASIEIKYDMSKDGSLVYDWSAGGEVLYDLHAHPTIGGVEAAVSFDQARATGGAGMYIASFDGFHGWFFENRDHSTVEVTLSVVGFIDGATLYEGNDQRRVELTE